MLAWFRNSTTCSALIVMLALGALAAATIAQPVVIEVADDGHVTITDPQQRVEIKQPGQTPDPPSTPNNPTKNTDSKKENDLDPQDRANPLDAAGFTVWPLRPGARTVYVANAGHDRNSGLAPNDPVRTLRHAMSLLRNRAGDHLRLHAGDTFHAGFGHWRISGHDAQHPALIGVYGHGDRPTIFTSGSGLLQTYENDRIDFVALQGLHAVAAKRDPKNPGFNPQKIPYRESGVSWFATGQGLHVEDCVFERFMFHFVLQNKNIGGLRNVTIRRSVLADAYSHYDGKKGGHSSGIFATGVTGLRLDENILDHNGWAEDIPGARRTKFNHNIYLHQRCRDLTVTRNIIARASSYGLQLRPGGRCENNLFAQNSHALYLAVAPSTIAHNVIAQSNDLNHTDDGRRGYGIVTWPSEHALIHNNLFMNKRGNAHWAGAIEITSFQDWSTPVPHYRVTLQHNTITNWPRRNRERSIVVYDKSAKITEIENTLDHASGGNTHPAFVNPDMTLDRAADGNFVAWLGRARQRPRGTWNPQLTAAHLNQKLFAAFALKPQ